MTDLAHPMATAEQPQPTIHPESTDVCELVKADLEARIQKGAKQYGQRLHTFNGRDSLLDAYQEILDLAVYLRQAIEESDKMIKENCPDFSLWAKCNYCGYMWTPAFRIACPCGGEKADKENIYEQVVKEMTE